MSAKKRQKVKKVQKIVPAGSKAQRCVLVGTYKKEQNQLKWIGKRHLYNYPLSAEEAQQPTDGWGKVKELWLYSGPKDKRHIYTAEYVGIKSRKDFLAEHPDYPKGKGKGHGDYYAAFSVRHKYQPTLDESVVVVRAADFKRTPKIAQAVRAYQAGGELGCLLDYLPVELASLTHDQLRVCEAAVQLDYFDEIMPVRTSACIVKPNGHTIRLATVFSGIGAIEQALLKDEIDHQIVFACDNGDVSPYRFNGITLCDFEKEYARLSERMSMMRPSTEGLSNAYIVAKGHFDALTKIVREGPRCNAKYERDLKDLVRMLHEDVAFYEFRVLWEKGHDWDERKHMVDMLYRPLLSKNLVRRSYLANYKISEMDFHWNVSFLEGSKYRDGVDLLVGGSPCQSFSSNGKRRGIQDTRGTLFYEYARIVDEVRPRCFIFENVKGMVVHDKGRTWKVVKETFKALEYDIYINRNDSGQEIPYLNSAHYGIPQTRERIFLVGIRHDICLKNPFEFPMPEPLRSTVREYQDKLVPDKYYLGRKGFEFVTTHPTRAQVGRAVMNCQKANQQFNWNGDFIFEDIKNFAGRSIPAKAYVGTWQGRTGVIRQYMPRECLRLMGFPDSFNIVVDDTVMYYQCGNSIVVDVLQKIVQQLIKTGVFDR